MNTIEQNLTDTYLQICLRIIKEQANIVGVLSWDEASKVKGLDIIDRSKELISISGDPKKVIDDLVDCYIKLFGRLSRDVSRESAVDLIADIPKDDVPESLK